MTSAPKLVTLGPDDIERMLELETTAFDSTMQADPGTILARFALGHSALGTCDQDGRLVGAICFSVLEVGDDYDSLPSTFKEYSRQPVPEAPDSLCIYSLGVVPSARGMACARLLIRSAFDEARRQGFCQVLADGAFPSFAGNDQVAPRPAVRQMLERYLETGRFPEQSEFLQDPVFAFYYRLTECRFVKLLPDFLPEDTASGGWRVLLQRDL